MGEHYKSNNYKFYKEFIIDNTTGERYGKSSEVKDKNGWYQKLPKEFIKEQIRQFYEYVNSQNKINPDKQYKIAYRNPSKESLNGYLESDLIDMYVEAGSIPKNIIFSKEWVDTGMLNITKSVNINIKDKPSLFNISREDLNADPQEISDNTLKNEELLRYLKDNNLIITYCK